ncbi:MAG: hypothetical protein IPM79_23575 [Polyangiaceae bacterium]|nr:hypothetical protein [Polyangiaceae bacterium]
MDFAAAVERLEPGRGGDPDAHHLVERESTTPLQASSEILAAGGDGVEA